MVVEITMTIIFLAHLQLQQLPAAAGPKKKTSRVKEDEEEDLDPGEEPSKVPVQVWQG